VGRSRFGKPVDLYSISNGFVSPCHNAKRDEVSKRSNEWDVELKRCGTDRFGVCPLKRRQQPCCIESNVRLRNYCAYPRQVYCMPRKYGWLPAERRYDDYFCRRKTKRYSVYDRIKCGRNAIYGRSK